MITRRGFLQLSLSSTADLILTGVGLAATASSMKDIEALQKNWRALLADGVKVPLPTEPLKLSKEEWRKRLDSAQFNILREEGTEPPGTSPDRKSVV